MKKLAVFPSDPISAYVQQGKSYEYLEGYFNPGDYFDEVYCLSLWGDRAIERKGKIIYIKCKPWEFNKKILELKPDVIRAYGGYISSDLAQLAKVDGIPLIVSVHDTNPVLIHDSVKYADCVVCMAECVKKAVEGILGISGNHICVMPNRIDVDLFSRKSDEEYFDKLDRQFGMGKHILHVGRKTEQKNLDTLIKSLQYLDDDVSAIFVGSGSTEKYLHLAKAIGVDNRCYWVPAVKKEELPLWYSWCDCFCTPSRWEGFGYVFIEAAGCEAPIVTSNIAPMNEYLTDRINSLLVDEYENPEALATSIKNVFNGGVLIEKMCQNARAVGLQFAKDKIDKMEVSIYEKVMKDGSKNKRVSKITRIKYMWKYRNY